MSPLGAVQFVNYALYQNGISGKSFFRHFLINTTIPGAINVFQTVVWLDIHDIGVWVCVRMCFVCMCICIKRKWFVCKQSAIEFHDDVDDDNTANRTRWRRCYVFFFLSFSAVILLFGSHIFHTFFESYLSVSMIVKWMRLYFHGYDTECSIQHPATTSVCTKCGASVTKPLNTARTHNSEHIVKLCEKRNLKKKHTHIHSYSITHWNGIYTSHKCG